LKQVEIASLPAGRDAAAGAHLDPERVAHYVRSGDAVRPIVVYETPAGPLVADGHHRIAAALERGCETIAAEVRTGSRHDALRYASATAAAERGMSIAAATEHIRRRSEGRWGRG
jgi:ParB-like chromosome segregation protein Spo0J